MGFMTGLLSAAAKAAITPLAVVADVMSLGEPDAKDLTSEVLESSWEDVEKSFEDLENGKLI